MPSVRKGTNQVICPSAVLCDNHRCPHAKPHICGNLCTDARVLRRCTWGKSSMSPCPDHDWCPRAKIGRCVDIS